MIREINETFESNNSELLETVYLPAKDNANIKDSKAFKILSDNNQDVSELFTGQKNEMYQPIEIEKYEEKNNKSLSEKYIEPIKELGNTLSDFVEDTIIGDVYKYAESGFDKEEIPPNAAILANNIAEFGVNLLPIMDKMIDFTATASVPQLGKVDVFNNDKALMEWSGEKVQWFRENRAKFKKIQEDDNMAAQFANLVVQDSLVSIPLYEALTRNGVGKKWATFLAFGLGSAIAIEKKIFGVESTFLQEYGKTEIDAVKKILNILPNTSVDDLADEVIQTFEYTAFAFAIPQLIKTIKFLKLNAASFTVPAAVAGVIEGQNQEPPQEFNLGTNETEKKNSEINLDDQSAIQGTVNEYGFEKTASLKAIVSAFKPKKVPVDKGTPVFSSAVKQAVEKIAEKGTGDQILGTIKNIPNVKANEIKWIGLDTFLQGKKSVTKKEVIDFVNQNSIDVNEVKFGGTTAQVSDELKLKINDFESKWLKANISKKAIEAGEGAVAQETNILLNNNLNYDVYKFKTKTYAASKAVNDLGEQTQSQVRALASETGIDEQLHKVDFASIIRFPFLKLIKNVDDFPKYLNAKGNIEIRTVETIGLSGFGRQQKDIVELSAKEADALLKSNSDNKLIATFEIDPLELEKAIVENAKREFRLLDTKAPKFETYTEAGGTDYTELVFSIKKGGIDIGIPTERKWFKTRPKGYEGPVGMVHEKGTTPYKSSHMRVKSEIAHVRFKTRTLDNGKKVLAVEEMQTDFGISATKAFKQTGKSTDFPFRNTWYELTIKRLIRYAADNGFDAISIPKGELAANRYGASIDKVKKLRISLNDDEYVVRYFDEKGMEVAEEVFTKNTLKELEKEIGIKKFNELLELEKSKEFMIATDGVNLPLDKEIIIGSGSGKFRLYNQTIPSFMKKYAKKWNAKVYDDQIEYVSNIEHLPIKEQKLFEPEVKIPVTILELTPAMKKSVKEQGQSLFEILGIGAGAGIAADSVSDNIQNNTISN